MTHVKDRPWGIYVWEGPNGGYLADEDGNLFCIESKENDLARMSLLAREARAMGYPDGKPVWKHGYRKISEEEYDLQMERLERGQTPDPADEYLDAVEQYGK